MIQSWAWSPRSGTQSPGSGKESLLPASRHPSLLPHSPAQHSSPCFPCFLGCLLPSLCWLRGQRWYHYGPHPCQHRAWCTVRALYRVAEPNVVEWRLLGGICARRSPQYLKLMVFATSINPSSKFALKILHLP